MRKVEKIYERSNLRFYRSVLRAGYFYEMPVNNKNYVVIDSYLNDAVAGINFM